MEPSGGLVLGLEPVGRKSEAVVHCHSERPLRVQCDGQSGALTLALCIRASWTLSLSQVFLSLSHNVLHTHFTIVFFSLSPRDLDAGKCSLCCAA